MNNKFTVREGMTSLVLEDRELEYFCDIIKEMAGIMLTPAKSELVKTRLRKRLEEKNLSSFQEYRMLLEKLPKGDPEWQSYINLLTTNKTDFFREPKHFDFLIKKFLPEWLSCNEGVLNIWCAASSTGEEPYTLSMILSEYLPKGREFHILATDIDTDVLGVAQNGVYSMAKYNEIPDEYRHLVDRGQGDVSGWFRIKPAIKQKIKFEQHNLIDVSSPGSSIFDLVFCRNVLIYFSTETIAHVSDKLYQSTKKNGCCLIGHAETFQNVTHQWKNGGPSIYKKIA